jgi:hypothetical protein
VAGKRRTAKDWVKLYPDLKSKLLSKDGAVVKTAMSTARNRLFRKNNPENVKESRSKHRKTDTYKKTTLEYKPQQRENFRRFLGKQPAGYIAERSARHRALKAKVTSPLMSLAEKLAIDSMYKGAAALSLPKRIINVDHFVPIQGKFSRSTKAPRAVSGLHNLLNLRWMEERANKAKGDLIPKQSLLQTENPTRNIFETIEKIRKSGGGGGAAPFPSSPWDPRGKLFRRWPILK